MAIDSTRDDVRTVPPAMDYASHRRQYRRFLHLTKWFVIHALIMLPALYFFLVGNQPLVGGILLAAAIAALGYGIVSTAGIKKDVEETIESVTDPRRSPE